MIPKEFVLRCVTFTIKYTLKQPLLEQKNKKSLTEKLTISM